jgi:outer membrane lipoprotein carrier protein
MSARSALLYFLILFIAGTAQAQNAGMKDPKAKSILQKLKKDFESAKTMEIDFNLSMEYPGEESDIQKGKLKQAGDKYHVETERFAVISDNKSVWFINKENKEGQINHAGKEDGFSLFSPIELLKIYERDDHNYALVQEYTDKNKVYQQVEFVPTDRGTDYSKARLTIEKTTGRVDEVRFFYKDGSRLVLKVLSLQKNKDFSSGQFTFQASKYPGVYMEDLRL